MSGKEVFENMSEEVKENEPREMTEAELEKAKAHVKSLNIPEEKPEPPQEESTDNEDSETGNAQSTDEEQEESGEDTQQEEENPNEMSKDEKDEQDRLCNDYYDELEEEIKEQEKERDKEYEQWCAEEETFNVSEEEQEEIENQQYVEPDRTFITEYTKFLGEICDADPEFIEADAIQTFATLLFDFKIKEATAISFRKFFSKTKNLQKCDGKPLNLWTIVFGESRKARKTTVMSKTEDLFTNMGIEHNVKILTPKSMTPQSLASLSKGVKSDD
jgi:hypothetical protein